MKLSIHITGKLFINAGTKHHDMADDKAIVLLDSNSHNFN